MRIAVARSGTTISRTAASDAARIALARQGGSALRAGGAATRRGQRGGGRQQQRLRVRVVFGLRQQVRGDEVRIGRLIGDHQHFRRAGRQVERRAVGVGGDQLLGRRHPAVAGSEDLVDLGDGCGAIGHRRDRLRAADLEDCVDAAQLRRDQHARIGAAVAARRRAQHPLRAAGESRRHRQHDRGRRERRGAGRHVQADRAKRAPQALATHAGLGLEASVARAAARGGRRCTLSMAVRERGYAPPVRSAARAGGEFRRVHLQRSQFDAVECRACRRAAPRRRRAARRR